ncbi:MAG: phosphatase PAP2 family protein [Clostridia bacterium]|nr:phosphatase PAP2 family protein [Clostridia bacterium]
MDDRNRKGRDYAAFYTGITAGIRKRKNGARLLKSVNDILRGIMVVLYPMTLCMIAAVCYREGLSIRGGVLTVMPFVAVPGISFVVLTLIRSCINRRRPYEQYDIKPLIPREKAGRSMPSRHVFSSVMIAMCVLRLSVPLGIAVLMMAAASAVVRVLAGIHFPGDVAAGFAAGVLSGCLLFLF